MNILSLDGGGTRGIYTIEILKNLEKKLNDKNTSLYDTFDLIAGTSTGAIIALAIACKIDLDKVANLYATESKVIFNQNISTRFIPIIRRFSKGQKYLENNLKELFFENGQDKKLSDIAGKKILIPVFDYQKGDVKMIKTPHHQGLGNDKYYYIYQVALSATAAPIFFNPISLHNTNTDSYGGLYLDGGIYNNNPVISAFLEANKTLGADVKDIKILSVGTCRYTPKKGHKPKKWYIPKTIKKSKLVLLYNIAKNLFDIMTSAQSSHTENMINFLNDNLLEGSNDKFKYLRLNEDMDDKIPLFTNDADDFNYLKSLASDTLKDNKITIDNFLEEITNG